MAASYISFNPLVTRSPKHACDRVYHTFDKGPHICHSYLHGIESYYKFDDRH